MTVAATSVPACWVRPPIPAFGDRLSITITSVLRRVASGQVGGITDEDEPRTGLA